MSDANTPLTWEGSYDEGRESHLRLARIMENMDLPPARVMDLGANVGYFSYGLSLMGYQVTAVEPPNEKIYEAELVDEHRRWVQSPADLPAGEFDYALVLSVLHHIPQWQSVMDHLLVHTRRAVFVEVPALSESHPAWHGSHESYEFLRTQRAARIIGQFPSIGNTAMRDLWKVDLV
jgi:SAM-dependent methyltransferase